MAALLQLRVLGRLGDTAALKAAAAEPGTWRAWHAERILTGSAPDWRHIDGNTPLPADHPARN